MSDQNSTNQAQLTAHEPDDAKPGKKLRADKPRRSIAGLLALLISLFALYMVWNQGQATHDEAIVSINKMITESVVPQVKAGHEKDVIGQIYALKHVMVTLEQIKETSANPQVQAMVDNMRKQVEELSVKLFVHE